MIKYNKQAMEDILVELEITEEGMKSDIHSWYKLSFLNEHQYAITKHMIQELIKQVPVS